MRRSQVYDDDIAYRAAFFLIDTTNPAEVLGVLSRHHRRGPASRCPRRADRGGDRRRRPEGPRVVRDDVRGRTAIRRVARARLETSRQRSSTSSRAGTDGASPTSAATRFRLPMRLLHVARDISLFLTAAGPDEARAVVERRSGSGVRSAACGACARATSTTCSRSWTRTRMWEQAHGERAVSADLDRRRRVDAAFAAIAALTGLKSPWLREHSTGVAELAEAAAWRLGLPRATVTLLRRAALAHDLGRVGVSNAIWEKPAPLGFGEWERVRLHPHFTERAFAQSPALAPSGLLAGTHHERLDGSGYHRGTRGPALDQAARILAAADCYRRCAKRPYRPALDEASCRGRVAARGRRGTARRRSSRRCAQRRWAPRAAARSRSAGRADRA